MRGGFKGFLERVNVLFGNIFICTHAKRQTGSYVFPLWSLNSQLEFVSCSR